MVISPVIGTLPELVAVKLGIPKAGPPEAPKPINIFVFVQLKVVPATLLLKTTAVVASPAQSCSSVIDDNIGVGLTVMVKLWVLPTQDVGAGPVGIIVIVATTGTFDVLIAVNAAIFPEPEAANPILGSEFVQEKEVPKTVETKFTAVVEAPLQTT